MLVCTNHMANIAGSEIVAFEVAMCFKKNNYHVDMVVNYSDKPMSDLVQKGGINLLSTDDLPDPFNYDIVWTQHQILPLLVNHYIDNFNNKTYFVFAHLSPYEPIETLGLYTERLIANKIIVNSKETFEHLRTIGLPVNISEIFYNAAPSDFFTTNNRKDYSLSKLLLISNHPPQEILEAIKILDIEYNISVRNIGLSGQVIKIGPQDIQDVDAVITIGKSVQYAIASETPVYCYDRFGGNGWLYLKNYKKSEDFNYSGRCCLRRISARDIVNEIIEGYEKAKAEIYKIKNENRDKYCLDFYIRNIIKNYETNNRIKLINQEDVQKIKNEAKIAKLIKMYFNEVNFLDKELQKVKLKYKNTFLKKLARKIKKIYKR